MPSTSLKRRMMVCGGLLVLAAGRASAQTHWREAAECAGAVTGFAAGAAVAGTQHDIGAIVLWMVGGTLAGDAVGNAYGGSADARLARGADLGRTQRAVLRTSTVLCGAVVGAVLAEPKHVDFARHEATRVAAGAVAGAAVALFVEQRFFDRALWPRERRLNVRVVPVHRGLALVVQRN